MSGLYYDTPSLKVTADFLNYIKPLVVGPQRSLFNKYKTKSR